MATNEIRPLSIALLSYSTRPRGGVVHTLALAEALAAAGQRVTIWTLGRGGDTGFFRPVDPAVRQVIVPFPDVDPEPVGARVLRAIATLHAALAGGPPAPAPPGRAAGVSRYDVPRYDIVHAQDCVSANAAGRCVRTVHHLDQFTTPALVACHERAITTPYAHICVSRAVAAELRAGWGINATVIPNGVDAPRFAEAAGPDPAAARARERWRARWGRYILAVGGIEPRKGSIELLEAYARLRERHPGVQLVIAGGETLFDYREYRAEWERRAALLGVAPVVLGPVADQELPSLVAAAAAFAFPSTKEGFGLAAMEALAAGVPVVLSDLPVLREVFAGAVRFGAGRDGLAAGLHEALERPDPDLLRAGRTLAARHTWAEAATRHLALYRRLTLARPRPVPQRSINRRG